MKKNIKSRYYSKLVSNTLGAISSIIIVIIVPRALGAVNYGKFDFITNNINQIINFLTLSIPNAFFIWISRKGKKIDISSITGVNISFFIIIIFLILFFIYISNVINIQNIIWPSIGNWLIIGGLLFSFGKFLLLFYSNLSDGLAYTTYSERIKIIYRILRSSVIFSLYITGLLVFYNYVVIEIILIFVTILSIIVWLFKIRIINKNIFIRKYYNIVDIKNYISFTYKYSKPLILLQIVTFVYLFFNRWFLIWVGGASEQGFFGLSYKFSTIILLFTSAATPIFTREFAYYYENNDKEKIHSLFDKVQLLLFLSLIGALIFSYNSKYIIDIIGKREYSEAYIPILIMSFYPVHQTLGQINGALLFATGRTKLYSRISIFMMIIGFPITYFLIAPYYYFIPGLGLGASGLALQMVTVQLISTNIQLYFNAKYLQTSYYLWLYRQVKIIISGIIILLSVHFIMKYIISRIVNMFTNHLLLSLLNILFSIVLFVVISAFVIISYPKIIGLKKINYTYLKSLLKNA